MSQGACSKGSPEKFLLKGCVVKNRCALVVKLPYTLIILAVVEPVMIVMLKNLFGTSEKSSNCSSSQDRRGQGNFPVAREIEHPHRGKINSDTLPLRESGAERAAWLCCGLETELCGLSEEKQQRSSCHRK